MAEDSSEIVREMAESVAGTNLKTLGDGPAFFQNMSYAQAIESAKGWTSINQAIIAKAAESILATDPREAGADVAGLMQLMKGGALTPPQST